MSFIQKLIQEENKVAEAKYKMKKTCPNCGRKMHFYAFEKKDKILCDWCGRYVFKNKKAEYDYRMKELLNKQK